MFNQCAPTFAGQFPFNGFNWNGFNNFQPFGFNGFQSFSQPFNWNTTTPFNGFNWNGLNGIQNWQGQNWNGQFNGAQNFDWNAFNIGCFFGFQNAGAWNANQGEKAPINGNTNPGSFGPFGFFPYGPFPFNFYAQNAANCCPPNQQAA